MTVIVRVADICNIWSFSHQEMISRRSSKKDEKTKEPDFGTYHHSTSAASKNTREVVKAMFTDAFASLPLRRDDKLQILDVGRGLGFLSCVSAEFYKNAQITGIDTFKHASLKQSSLKRAKENTSILGFSDRIDFSNVSIAFSTIGISQSILVFVNSLCALTISFRSLLGTAICN